MRVAFRRKGDVPGANLKLSCLRRRDHSNIIHRQHSELLADLHHRLMLKLFVEISFFRSHLQCSGQARMAVQT